MVVRYEGTVQGVGFRYTVVHIAGEFDVTGYVQNLPDGSVRLVAEGWEPVLLDFLKKIRNSYVGRYVTKEQIQWSKARSEFKVFDVKYGY